MEYYDNPLTPSMGGAFSMAETNPFEYSFQANKAAPPAPIVVPTSMADIRPQMPPTPVSSTHSSPRQSVHEEGSDRLSEGSGRTASPKIRTRSRTTPNKQQHQDFSSKRKWEQDDDDEDGEEKRRKFLERNRQAGK